MHSLNLEELQSVEPIIDFDALELLKLESSKEARKSLGGASDYSVDIQLNLISDFLNSNDK